MSKVNTQSNGVPVFDATPKNDICTVNAWLNPELWEVKNRHYTHKVDSFSDYNRDFSVSNINEFIDGLTATGKYTQICVNYHDSN